MGGIQVEVPLRLLVDAVVHEFQTSLHILANLRIGIGDGATVVVHKHAILRLGDIGNTQILLTGLLVLIHLREDVHKHEVIVGAYEQSLSACSVHFLACLGQIVAKVFGMLPHLLFNLVEIYQCVIGGGDGSVGVFPNAGGRVGTRRRLNLLEAEQLVVHTLIRRKVIAHDHLRSIGVGRIVRSVVVHEVIARQLAHPAVVGRAVAAHEQIDDLVNGLDFNSLIGLLVKEAVTARCKRECHQAKRAYNIFQ